MPPHSGPEKLHGGTQRPIQRRRSARDQKSLALNMPEPTKPSDSLDRDAAARQQLRHRGQLRGWGDPVIDPTDFLELLDHAKARNHVEQPVVVVVPSAVTQQRRGPAQTSWRWRPHERSQRPMILKTPLPIRTDICDNNAGWRDCCAGRAQDPSAWNGSHKTLRRREASACRGGNRRHLLGHHGARPSL